EGGQDADLKGGRAQRALIDNTEGDEGPGAEAGKPVGAEEQPPSPVDPDPKLGLVAAPRRCAEARGARWQHIGISRRPGRPIEVGGDEPVKPAPAARLRRLLLAQADTPMQAL